MPMARRRQAEHQRKILVRIITALAVLLAIGILALLLIPDKSDTDIPTKTVEETQEETLPTNTYHEEDFIQTDDYLRYADEGNKIGVDVSAHQGVIDWEQVHDAGIEFAVIRAGYRGSTEGKLYEDAQFRYNMEEAENAGIATAVYFYSQAVSVEEAEEEAEFVCELLEAAKPELPVFFDWEEGDGSGRTSEAGYVPVTELAIAFCEKIKSAGYDAGVYFNLHFAYHQLNMAQLQDYTLWLAEYNLPPTYQYRYDWLQYSDGGTVPGIGTFVDMDMIMTSEPAE